MVLVAECRQRAKKRVARLSASRQLVASGTGLSRALFPSSRAGSAAAREVSGGLRLFDGLYATGMLTGAALGTTGRDLVSRCGLAAALG